LTPYWGATSDSRAQHDGYYDGQYSSSFHPLSRPEVYIDDNFSPLSMSPASPSQNTQGRAEDDDMAEEPLCGLGLYDLPDLDMDDSPELGHLSLLCDGTDPANKRFSFGKGLKLEESFQVTEEEDDEDDEEEDDEDEDDDEESRR